MTKIIGNIVLIFFMNHLKRHSFLFFLLLIVIYVIFITLTCKILQQNMKKIKSVSNIDQIYFEYQGPVLVLPSSVNH